jgi:hypothetical protein
LIIHDAAGGGLELDFTFIQRFSQQATGFSILREIAILPLSI